MYQAPFQALCVSYLILAITYEMCSTNTFISQIRNKHRTVKQFAQDYPGCKRQNYGLITDCFYLSAIVSTSHAYLIHEIRCISPPGAADKEMHRYTVKSPEIMTSPGQQGVGPRAQHLQSGYLCVGILAAATVIATSRAF